MNVNGFSRKVESSGFTIKNLLNTAKKAGVSWDAVDEQPGAEMVLFLLRQKGSSLVKAVHCLEGIGFSLSRKGAIMRGTRLKNEPMARAFSLDLLNGSEGHNWQDLCNKKKICSRKEYAKILRQSGIDIPLSDLKCKSYVVWPVQNKLTARSTAKILGMSIRELYNRFGSGELSEDDLGRDRAIPGQSKGRRMFDSTRVLKMAEKYRRDHAREKHRKDHARESKSS